MAALSYSLDILMYLIEERKCSPAYPGQWGRYHITVQKSGYTLSDILRIFRVYASRIPLAE